MDPALQRVGYWWSEKKSRKLDLKELTQVFRDSGLDLVKINLNEPLESQGPFAAIIHKSCDLIIKAQDGDLYCSAIYNRVQRYLERHPNIAVIDPFPNIEKLLHRYRQYELVEGTELSDHDVFVPAYVEMTTTDIEENLDKMKEAGIEFPIVSKPSIPHDGSRSHQMSLIFNAAGLRDVRPPCVAQQFIQHDATLFKLFVLGDRYAVQERPSLKNFLPGDHETIFFDSNNISKPHSASALTEPEDKQSIVPPSKEKLDLIVDIVHRCVDLDLLGIDVSVEKSSGRLAIIDVNVFPGYNDVVNYYSLLCDLVLKKIKEKECGASDRTYKPVLVNDLPTPGVRCGQKFTFDTQSVLRSNNSLPSKCFCCPISESCINSSPHCKLSSIQVNGSSEKLNGFHEDSGIETSDSCDERKSKISIPR